MRLLQLVAGVILLVAYTSMTAYTEPKVITWKDLIPADNAQSVDFSTFNRIKGAARPSTPNGSPQNMDFMRQMQPQDGTAVAIELNGEEVKIAGYVTPLSIDDGKVVDFLFVPYLGACIHVPPPAANQIVYVENARGLDVSALYEPLWLTGEIKATPISTMVANVGYSISDAKIEPYRQ